MTGDSMVYLAFIFALALACVAGMEFVSLMVLDTRNRQLKRRLAQLEHENARLSASLSEMLEREEGESVDDDLEHWPELIDDERGG